MFIYVPKEQVIRVRPEMEAKTVKGTRKIHCVSLKRTPYNVKFRDLSCFCESCSKGNPCKYEYIDPWTEVSLQLKQKAAGDTDTSTGTEHYFARPQFTTNYFTVYVWFTYSLVLLS